MSTKFIYCKNQTSDHSLNIADFSLEIKLNTFLVKTIATFNIQNTSEHNVEAELIYPLEEGATISGFAVDINGNIYMNNDKNFIYTAFSISKNGETFTMISQDGTTISTLSPN